MQVSCVRLHLGIHKRHLITDAIPLARARLSQLFDHTLTSAHSSSEAMLAVGSYSSSTVKAVLASAHTSSANKYEAYLARRKAGGPRELFPTKEHAKEWLRLAAVVKYVDGGWISSIMNEVSGTLLRQDETRDGTPSRQAGKMAWQVISEEFGDGDLEKNHISMYYALMDQLGVGGRTSKGTAMPGHMRGFDGLKEDEGVERCWKAAIAQQCIGVLSTEFFPEALGFNMAYECLPYHLLVTSRELRELNVDDTYFALHITIDNPDSGHAALARLSVERYLEGVKMQHGAVAMQQAWKRVQTGFMLADCLPTTPWSPIEFEKIPNSTSWRPASLAATATPPSKTEDAMAKLMRRKAIAAEKMHCPSKMVIKKRTLEQWLDPKSLSEDKALEFVRAMADARAMVKKGDVAGSRLMKELEWGGRMFGAFSRGEVDVVRKWIQGLGEDGAKDESVTYESFTGRTICLDVESSSSSSSISTEPRSMSPRHSFQNMTDLLAYPIPPLVLAKHDISRLVPLWLTSLTLLEVFPLSPTKLSSPLGMSVIRLIRSQAGFAPLHQADDICAGLDDFGMDFEHDVRGLWEVAEVMAGKELVLGTVLRDTTEEVRRQCEELLRMRNEPYSRRAELLGLTLGFARGLHGQVVVQDRLEKVEEGRKLQDMVQRITAEEVEAVVECVELRLRDEEEVEHERYWSEFGTGYLRALGMVESI